MMKYSKHEINANVSLNKSFSKDIRTSIKTYISILRNTGLSYGQIEKRSEISRGQIFKIEKSDYFPKTQKSQFRIFFRLASLFEIKLKD